MRAYESVEFLAPVYAGDFIEAVGRLVRIGNTSRTVEYEAWKVIAPSPEAGESAADVLDPPILVCRATGTGVTLKDRQRKPIETV
jgi:3-aminobutyryl-CoA ammonia-lyase